MEKATLNFPAAAAEVVTAGNIIYIRVTGVYSDAVALDLIRYLDRIIERTPGDPIRVWDAGSIAPEGFKLSPECIDVIAQWARALRAKRPGSLAYMVSPTSISYGMSRMYAIKSDLDATGVITIHSLDDLPGEIQAKLRL